MKKLLGCLLLIISLTSFADLPNRFLLDTAYPITGQEVPSKKPFENQFATFLRMWKIPGAAVAIIQNGRLTYARGFGYADLRTQQKVMPDSLFRIASLSKTFTAATILRLVQNGQLNLNTPLLSILNDVPPLPGSKINPRAATITIKNLLQMSSGWAGGARSDIMFGPWSAVTKQKLGEVPASCYQVLRLMESQAPRFRPGSSYDYSNLDYCVLGLVVDKITGQPYDYQGYEHYVQQNLLQPLMISNMAIGNTELSGRLPDEVVYYNDESLLSPDEILNSFYLPYSSHQILHKNFANGGWLASAVDLAKFVQGIFNGQVINSKMLAIMTSRPSFRKANAMVYYTMGMIVKKIRGQTYYVFTGSFTGSNGMIVRRPDGTIIAVVFNTRPAPYSFWVKFRPRLQTLLLGAKV